DIDLYDDAGNPCVCLRGLSSRQLPAISDTGVEDGIVTRIVQSEWMNRSLVTHEAASAPPLREAGRRLVVLCDIAVKSADLQATLPDCEVMATTSPTAAEADPAARYEAAALVILRALQVCKREAGNTERALLVQIV